VGCWLLLALCGLATASLLEEDALEVKARLLSGCLAQAPLEAAAPSPFSQQFLQHPKAHAPDGVFLQLGNPPH